MEIILFLIVIYFLCKLVEKAGEWFEKDYPSFQEARHKKIRKEKFNVCQPEELLGLQPKNLETLKQRAAAYALKMTLHMQDWPAATRKEYYDTYFNYYFNKYKYIYS